MRGAGRCTIVLALAALAVVIVVCVTVVTLVFAVSRRDRLNAIRQLTPVLLGIAGKIRFWHGQHPE
ncbi:hypothetical protein [Streptomyces sp. NPDC051554]|uniref:hypothetical protein n=1 Tax=Streptomyces sp. NPDC051554 TaxID=3365656 RepID=UPI00378A172D